MTIKNYIKKLTPWFHNIHLPSGIQTSPNHFLGDFPSFKWKQIKGAIPENLTGWKVLDIGCNAGYYSIKLAERGADVTAIDLDTHYLKQAEWVTKQFGLCNKITFKQMQVYDIAFTDEQFDLIWFMGVLYHLRYPMFALDILSQKSKKMIVLQTLLISNKKEFNSPKDIKFEERKAIKTTDWPSLYFIEHKLAGDPTNWWIPNHTGIKAMLHSCGFTITEMPEEETYIALKEQNTRACINSWNYSEYLSATGKKWKEEAKKKTNK